MTDSEKITYIREVGEFTEKNDNGEYVVSDAVLSARLNEAEDAIMNRAYPYGYDESMDFPKKYEILSLKIAIFLQAKAGAEGETEHDENGIVRKYGNADIPAEMLTTVIPHCASFGGGAT